MFKSKQQLRAYKYIRVLYNVRSPSNLVFEKKNRGRFTYKINIMQKM